MSALMLLPLGIAHGQEALPRAVEVARATVIPECTLFVDAAASNGRGLVEEPYATIWEAVDAAEPGAVICVAEGEYREQVRPGEKPFTLAGGFESGAKFSVRDSAAFVSHAIGDGTGSFLRIEDPGPAGDVLTAIDGFEISGYSQAIVRDFYVSQRFDITNSFIHDNTCTEAGLAGAGFSLSNVSGTISGNVIRNNRCDRGGAGFLYDSLAENSVVIESNLIEANAGVEADYSHGGALYLFGKELSVVGNTFTDNTVTGWGGGLYLGAFTAGGVYTTANIAFNFYRGNSAGVAGGGMFCDDGATCFSDHEIYVANCAVTSCSTAATMDRGRRSPISTT